MLRARWARRLSALLLLSLVTTAEAACTLVVPIESHEMLPIGTAKGYGQPYQPCSPGPLGHVPGTGPLLSRAVVLTDSEAQGELAVPSELVTYRIGGHAPLGGDANRVTVPSAAATLRAGARMRLFIGGDGATCIHRWRVSARSLDGYDGTQEAGATWHELGSGEGQADAVVVAGVDEGSWIVHVHVEFGPDGAAQPDTLDSYARVATGLVGNDSPPPAPELVAACGERVTPLDAPPVMALSTDGRSWTPGEGAVQDASGSPAFQALPMPVVTVAAGSLLRIRTVDGSCGNDWGGAAFAPVPDNPSAIGLGGSGLVSNDGGDRGSPTIQPLGGVNAYAPAPGDWMLSVQFWFGERFSTTYVWHIAVR